METIARDVAKQCAGLTPCRPVRRRSEPYTSDGPLCGRATGGAVCTDYRYLKREAVACDDQGCVPVTADTYDVLCR